MNQKRSFFFQIFVVMSTILLMAGLLSGCFSRGKKAREEEAITVLIQKAKVQSFQQFIDLNGQIAGRNEVKVYADVSGKIAQILVKEGSYVSKGSVIAYIDRAQVGADYALAPVKAPISGYVTSVSVVLGQMISPGTVPVASIGSLTEMDVIISLPERFVRDVEIGQTVYLKVAAYPDERFTATIYRKDLAVDPTSRTLTVRAQIQDPRGKLLSGMFADVSILVRESSKSIVIPSSALVELENGKQAVYVNQDNVAKIRPVSVAFGYKDKVAIQQGLNPGEEVIIYGKEFLKDGTPIYPVEEEN
ncbi:efflux RND transporter periplasmic adaptor subunit [Thermospira aquatica]|uniref:Efflux RND transporter periplasmic adaptor subunit n=1 Tax=Thermospira aquatica TaxID=2828656 RepID=A0AAX3BAI5_9SPIR|nr:efflux RND transporter periplasmic adaptor subunit [Thermospira aquatica]URA09272.1 efflux RND transporter periplasmic adaptor subunit [Thermospira aquatica]